MKSSLLLRVWSFTTRAVLLVLTATVILPHAAEASPAPGTVLWHSTFGPSSGAVSALAVSPDGSKVFAAGGVVVAAFTTSGVQAWVKTVSGANLTGVVVSPDGTKVFVSGTRYDGDLGSGGTIEDVLTIGFEVATGNKLWTRTYDRGAMDGDPTTTSQHDYGYAIGISPDGNSVFVVGEVQRVFNSNTHPDYGTLSYDAATGHREWASFYDGGVGADSPRSLVVSPDGSAVYVTGYSASNQSSALTTVAYDTSDGSQKWVQPWEGPAGRNETGWSLAADPDGSAIYLTGGTGGTDNGTQDWDIVTMALDTTDGSVLWDKLLNGPSDGYDFGRSVTVNDAGTRVYVVGHSRGSAATYDITTLAYNVATGDRLWVRRAPGPSVNFGLTGDVAVSPDGSKILVASYRARSGQTDTSTISYSAAGALRWKDSSSVTPYDRLTSAAINPAGTRAFVGGSTSNDAILAYKL